MSITLDSLPAVICLLLGLACVVLMTLLISKTKGP